MKDEYKQVDWDLISKASFQDLIGMTCPGCKEGISVWYGWHFRAMNGNCDGCYCTVRMDGLKTPPPWAEPNANTSINTLTGERLVASIPIPPTVDEIDVVRGVMDADLRTDNWTTCPHCKITFATYNKHDWDGERHLACRTRLNLVQPHE